MSNFDCEKQVWRNEPGVQVVVVLVDFFLWVYGLKTLVWSLLCQNMIPVLTIMAWFWIETEHKAAYAQEWGSLDGKVTLRVTFRTGEGFGKLHQLLLQTQYVNSGTKKEIVVAKMPEPRLWKDSIHFFDTVDGQWTRQFVFHVTII